MADQPRAFVVYRLQHHESTPKGTPQNFSWDRSGAWKKLALSI